MRTGKRAKLHILILTVCMLLIAWPAVAEKDEPLTLTVEADPDCLLSEAGDMTFFRFTVKNNLDEEYVLEDMSLQGDVISAPMLIKEHIAIKANDVLEFTLENVRIEDFMLDLDLSFQLTWRTTTYAPEDEERLEPIVQDHMISAPIRIDRFIEPVMGLSVFPDVHLARKGDPITVTYTLINDTKFDMTNITLQDAGIPQPIVPLEKTTLNAGERMQASATFQMGDNDMELAPTVQSTVRGVESKTTATDPAIIEHVDVELSMRVEQYPATSEGTLFRITMTNNGSHPMSDIRIVDEIGTLIAEGIRLNAGKEKTVSCTVPSAVSSGTVRYISFEATGLDCVGGSVTVKSPSAYEVLPFVDSDQVRLNLSVTLTSSTQNDDGSNRMKLLFDIRNDSLVPISNAIVSESDYYKGVVNEFSSLSTGNTSFEKEFVVPAGTRSLTFVLTAMDPAQTQYATVPMTMDLSPLTAPKPTNVPAIKPGKTVDITGTIYDTERYAKMFRMAALIVLALTLMFLLLSVIFRVAEMNIRRFLPKESTVRPFGARKTPTGPIAIKESAIDPVHDLFGYQQPAKLRYMDRTDRMPAVDQDEAFTPVMPINPIPNAFTGTLPGVSRNTSSTRREGDITAVPIHKTHARPVMMSTDDTMPFAPVREEQAPEAQDRIEPQSHTKEDETPLTAEPRVIEMKPVPRIVPQKKLEIVHVTEP